MKKILLFCLLTLLIFRANTLAAFNDVNNSTDYKDAIEWMNNNGAIDGYPDGTFQPDKCVNRVEMLKMLFLANETPLDNSTISNPFTDTNINEWYWPYLKTAYQNRVVEGYPNGKFKPSQCVNRAEAIKMAILEFNNGQIPNFEEGLWAFADIDRTAWYGQYIVPALFNNLVGTIHMTASSPDQVEGGNFYPSYSMTRKEVAEMLYRMKTVKDNNVQVYPWNNNLAPFSISNSSNQIAFDGCGTLDKYSTKFWFSDLESKYASGNYMEDSVGVPYGEGCLSLDGSLFILIPSDYAQAHGCGRIFKYDIPNSTLSEAAGEYCAAEFGLRVNDYVQFTGHQNNQTCLQYDGKYYFDTNIVTTATSTC